ncbi:MAG: GntR family transcriptional regulator [Pleomorphochaeta sp.]
MARIKSNSSKIAFDYIKDKIDRYSLYPGSTVSDLVISQELNISRTPVREAIQELIQYNLIEKQRTKFVVKGISDSDINEIIDCREAVEVQAARIIIKNGGLSENEKKEIERIEKVIENSLIEKDYYLNFKSDALFHNSIVKFSKNSRLIDIMKSLTIQGERLRWLAMITPDRYDNAINEHKMIIKYIEEKKEIKLRECIGNHLNLTKLNYEKITSNASLDQIIIAFKQLV